MFATAASTLRSASLHTKLTLALAVLVTLVAGGSAYFLIDRERDRRLVELEQRATRIADLLSRSLALPLWNVCWRRPKTEPLLRVVPTQN